MKRELITRTSDVLGKDMSLIAYGDRGYPVIAFQPQNSKCNALEDFGMVEALSDSIESGAIQLFSVDNNDEESWSATEGDKAARALRQESYFAYVTDELVPLVHEMNGSDLRPLAIGCSMGATHAALAALRRPDLFQGCIALSGIYDARYYFGDWMDSVLYDNSIVSFLPNMDAGHPYIELYGKRQLVFCVGQGAWEDQGIADLRVIADTCHEKGIDAWCDFWGYDVSHDWPWWKKQIRYFLPIVLDDMDKSLAEEERSTTKRTTRKATTKRVAHKAADDAKKVADKVASRTKKTTTKAAAGARRTARKVAEDASAKVKSAKGDMAITAEVVADEIGAGAKRAKAGAEKDVLDAKAKVEAAATKVEEGAEKLAGEAKAAARRGTTRAKATVNRTEAKAKQAVEKAVKDTKAAAKGTTSRAKATVAKARTAAKTTAAGVEREAEKVAGSVKDAVTKKGDATTK